MTNYLWADFKALLGAKNLNFDYIDIGIEYRISAYDGQSAYACSVLKDGGSEQTDFETNYKARGNTKLSTLETAVFSGLAIRTSGLFISAVSPNQGCIVKTVIIENMLNQTVRVQCQGARTSGFERLFTVGSEWTVPASSTTYQTCESYIPYWRVTAKCDTAPTSGDLGVFMYRVSE